MKYILFIILFFCSYFNRAEGYQIEVILPAAANKQIYLSHYYLGNVYVDDSLKLDSGGTGLFAGDTLLHQGLYKIYLDENNHFDFLLGGDQHFSLSNAGFTGTEAIVKESDETEGFISYVKFLSDLKQHNGILREELKNADDGQKKKLQEEISGLTPRLHEFQKSMSNKFPGTFLAKFVMANYILPFDELQCTEEVRQNDSLLFIARFNHQLKHYWDHFDYTDERFLFTPLYKPKIETWFNKVLYPNYDSVKISVFQFIEDIQPNKRIFQFAVSFFLNSSIQSNIMGMDALFVDIAKRWYLSGEAFWVSDKTMEKIRENVLFLENNLIGRVAPDLTMESYDGEFINLHQVQAKRTCLLIYEPNCSHCKVFIPQFHKEIYKKYSSKGLKAFAIYSMDNKEEWTAFLDEHQLWDWINVWDKDHSTRFKILYDARKTPGVYLLDENKRIIGKKLSIEQLDGLLSNDLLK